MLLLLLLLPAPPGNGSTHVGAYRASGRYSNFVLVLPVMAFTLLYTNGDEVLGRGLCGIQASHRVRQSDYDLLVRVRTPAGLAQNCRASALACGVCCVYTLWQSK